MSVQILSGDQGAVMFCNTTEWAFGPLMPSADVAEGFIKWLGRDVREYTRSELREGFNNYRRLNVCADCSGVRETECIDCEDGEPVDGWHGELRCEIEPEPQEGSAFVCNYCTAKAEAPINV